jgi:crossover junction endodeoxyribonuclease RusA
MLEFQLPWPPSSLSPNARPHWSKLYKAKREYRHACWGTALSQPQQELVPEGPLHIELHFVPPNRREHDRDNLVARMKSGLDGLADALKINDKRFTTLTANMSTDSIGGFVRIRITKETPP